MPQTEPMKRRVIWTLNEEERQLVCTGFGCMMNCMDLEPHEHEELIALANRFVEPVPDVPLWRSDLFTDEEREQLATLVMEEISDCVKDLAHDQLDNEPLIELISYIDDDPDVTIECLQALDNGNCSLEDLESGEHAEHELAARTIRRFKLYDPEKEDITAEGHDYIARNS